MPGRSAANRVFLDSALFGILNNSGTLTGIGGAAVRLLLSASVTLTNEGTIRGDTGIELIDSYATILNSGSIVATAYGGFGIDSSDGVGAVVIRNTGRIEAPLIAIQGGASSESVTNTGVILGDVYLGGSDDAFLGRYGQVEGTIFAGIGNDRILSGAGDDTVYGDVGNDFVRGNAGDDVLFGGQGGDTLRGDDGDDVLSGAGGPDVFVFNRHADDDRITDFTNGQDRIDLSVFRFANFAALSALAVDRAGGLLIDLASLRGGTVFVGGFIEANFDAGDVIL